MRKFLILFALLPLFASAEQTDSIAAFVEENEVLAEVAETADSTATAVMPEMPVNTHDHPYYNWKRDITYAGLPLIGASFIIKEKKKAFRSARMDLQGKFATKIDNYTQFAPYAVLVGLKAFGYEGRSSWPRLIVSAAASNLIMAGIVNSVKYSVKELRPDNSTKNSFPSGHTATAFTAATIFHKEYGTTRSPWFSIGGYAVATGTGIMRVLNNRHWISDVMAGAGVGIISAELGYFISDLIFREKGVKRFELGDYDPNKNPSFFEIQMGMAMHTKEVSIDYESGPEYSDKIELGTSTAFGVEGAYFFNKYLGVGAMGRVTVTPAKGMNLTKDERVAINNFNQALMFYNIPGIYGMSIYNNNFVDASFDAGLYFNYNFAKRWSVGAKLLSGWRFRGSINYQARNGFPKKQGEYVDPDGFHHDVYWFERNDGTQFLSSEILQPGVSSEYNYVLENPSETYDLMKVKAKNSMNLVTGVSLTWHYKSNFAWRLFFDCDFSKTTFNYEEHLFAPSTIENLQHSPMRIDYPEVYDAIMESQIDRGVGKKWLNFFTIGGAFTITI